MHCLFKALPPMREKVFSSVEADELQQIYEQLYPGQTLTFLLCIGFTKR